MATIDSVSKLDNLIIINYSDGTVTRMTLALTNLVASVPPEGSTEVGVIYVNGSGELVIQHNSSTLTITPGGTQTGAEIVTLLEALAAGDRLDHGAGLSGLGDDDHTQYIKKTLFDAYSIIAADTDNIPAAIAMAASTIPARLAAGGIVAATPAQILAILTSQAGAAFDWNSQSLTGINVLTATTINAFTLGGTLDANSQAIINVLDLDLGTESITGTFSATLTAANAGTAWLIQSKDTSDILRPRLALTGGVDTAVWAWVNSTHTGIVLGGALDANGNAITGHTQAISDNAILTVDHITPVATDYARFTANGLEGREKSEVLGDLNVADGADVTGSNAPQAHKASHQDTGGDEISVTALSGLLADDQHVLDTEAVSAVEVAGLTFAENKGIILDALLSGDEKWSGISEIGTMGFGATVGDLIYLAVADTKWELAKADVAATSKGKIGLCLATVSEDATCQVLLYGKMRSAAFPAFTVGAPVHISAATAGDMAVAAPTGTTNFVVRIIGYGNTAEDLFFCPDNSYVELA